jgi:hypothetical protein
MRKASDSEKNVALEWVQAKLNELQASPQQFIKPKVETNVESDQEILKERPFHSYLGAKNFT